ncbi:MAG: response regulator [Chloroflexaceae bacterium]|nr:response regulator [Chloroflexaceae bacterium]NJL34670.1 response regulator [Chloroflexaceae bacterium]NJO06974.1 response regulator [Chloroflexaceae bacterium]
MTTRTGTIVLIDDDVALQTVLEMALTNEGFTVCTANDGEQALQLIADVQPDLVISDIMMPNMDGVEMFQRIKEHLQDDGIPIIIMTALNRKPWFDDLEIDGAVILQKPFQIDYLLNLVNVSLEPLG